MNRYPFTISSLKARSRFVAEGCCLGVVDLVRLHVGKRNNLGQDVTENFDPRRPHSNVTLKEKYVRNHTSGRQLWQYNPILAICPSIEPVPAAGKAAPLELMIPRPPRSMTGSRLYTTETRMGSGISSYLEAAAITAKYSLPRAQNYGNSR